MAASGSYGPKRAPLEHMESYYSLALATLTSHCEAASVIGKVAQAWTLGLPLAGFQPTSSLTERVLVTEKEAIGGSIRKGRIKKTTLTRQG